MSYLVAALYHFARFPDFESFRAPLQAVADDNGVKGTLLIAHEGINGTIAGSHEGIANVLAFIRARPELAGMEHKESHASKMPFNRMKVRLKKEIVTMGVDNIDPLKTVGTYVEAKDWNDLISDPDTIVIDTRNDYETAIGIFRGAVDPQTKTFREFPRWVAENQGLHNKPKIAMYCTRRHPLREGDRLHEGAGLRRGLSPERRHPEISGGSAGRGKSVGWRLLRLRRARFRHPRPEGR